MACLTVNIDAVRHNIRCIDGIVRGHGARWTLVTKVMSGWGEVLQFLVHAGVRSIADSRLENLDALDATGYAGETWYLRPPCTSDLRAVVARTDCSLNSDIAALEALGAEAGRQGKIHRVVVMVELGDLREGVLPGTLSTYFERAGAFGNIRLVGLGGNLGCLSGAVPTVDQFSQLVLYRELMRLKFGVDVPLISAGTSAVLPMALDGSLPCAVNHFRIGETVFLGNDLIRGGTLAGMRSDVVTLEAEVVEVGEKSSVPPGEIQDIGPFEHMASRETKQKRSLRAVVAVGQLDTVIQGLTCENPSHSLVGASSDLAVVDLGGNVEGIKVGDNLRFSPNYAALVRLTASRYVQKRIRGGDSGDSGPFDMPPVLPEI